MDKIILPQEFCADMLRDIVQAVPFDRRAVAMGYAKTLEAMLVAKYEEGKRDAANES
jgi:hypothetical protein